MAMKTQQYKIDINASASRVYDLMLNQESYKLWTAEFGPTSDFDGSWAKGAKIIFTAIGEDGKKQGMVAKIRENIPATFVSIEHYGVLSEGEEVNEGPAVEEWAGSLENYTFDEKDGVTTLTVDVDTTEKYIDYFNETWPRALKKLKDICEASS
ncbi:SRPBCC domain-containing protein [Siphonobacter sp. SORGH_AS_0500]|uniref:SRPBCC domain-containing protein n=1 Tax=Siphonobacter sp. SORGH_AS_0500 TaxID=1864824 RepID=UPI002859EBFD|nr:SRPBCC domain-containing protein [Siphonobacter sp. SORGH_AS_0500]MDR6196102.1 hypothetical protein [Siphonobacter sp. SORGH_AS_0500]